MYADEEFEEELDHLGYYNPRRLSPVWSEVQEDNAIDSGSYVFGAKKSWILKEVKDEHLEDESQQDIEDVSQQESEAIDAIDLGTSTVNKEKGLLFSLQT